MKKKKKFVNNKQIINNKINDTNFTIPYNYSKSKLDINSWFSIFENDFTRAKNNPTINDNLNFAFNYDFNIDKINNEILTTRENHIYKGILIQFFPDDNQKIIINNWIESYRIMLNETIKFFKNNFFNDNKIKADFKNIRTNHLKDIKNNIYNKSQLNNFTKNTKIYSHSLDYAIKDICTNVKSAYSNLKNGNIKKFRLRYIKKTKKTKLMKIEKCAISVCEYGFYNKILGILKTDILDDFLEIESDCTILYRNNRYFLLIPKKEKCKITTTNKTIALDGGLRTFLTGYSNNEAVDICPNLISKIKPLLKQLNSINSKIDTNKLKNKKGISKRYRKINNLINELHWKTIKFLCDNYDNILLGNLSTKNIVSKENKLPELLKRIAYSMKLFVFKQRLTYKCILNGKQLVSVNESYTSKICSSCGNQNKKKDKSKIFNCESCKEKLDRDYNGAKNIYIIGTKYN